MLISRGANVEARDLSLGETALMHAAIDGHLACLTALIEAGAIVDATSDNGSTALMFAAMGGHLACLTACIEAGASVNVADETGISALDYATAMGDLDAMRQLLRRGASLSPLRGEDLELAFNRTSLFVHVGLPHGIAFVEYIHAAGGWNRYVQRPWFALVKLSKLCVEGRATLKPEARPLDPSMLAAVRLLGAQAEDPAARPVTPVPSEVFRHIVEYWRWG